MEEPTQSQQKTFSAGMVAFLTVGLATVTGIVLFGLNARPALNALLGKKVNTEVPTVNKKQVLDTLPSTVSVPGDDPRMSVRNGLTLWMRADGVERKDGDSVAIVGDASGKNFHPQQPLRVSRPRFVANGINGMPAFEFDGRDDFFAVGNLGASSAASVFCVWAKPDSGGSVFQRVFSSSSNGVDYEAAANGMYHVPEGTGQGTDKCPPTLTTLISTTPKNIDNFVVGRLNAIATQFFFGRIAEVIVFNRALNAKERSSVESYLKAKYKL